MHEALNLAYLMTGGSTRIKRFHNLTKHEFTLCISTDYVRRIMFSSVVSVPLPVSGVHADAMLNNAPPRIA